MPTEPRADVLAKLLVMQTVIGQLPDEERITGFLSRALQDVPGVAAVRVEADRPAAGHGLVFPLHVDDRGYGVLVVDLNDAGLFEPYRQFINNLSFMVAVILDSRRLRDQANRHQRELESRVVERTQALQQQVLERQAAEEAAKATRDQAERYLEIAEALIVELDRTGRITVINSHGADLLGYTQQELLGRDWFAVAIVPAQREEMAAFFQAAMSGSLSSVEYYENPILTRSGRLVYMSWHNRILVDDQGQPIGVTSSGIDITRYRLAEEALSAEKERLAVTLRSIGDGVITVDSRGCIELCNQGAERMLGVEGDEIGGHACLQVFADAAADSSGTTLGQAVQALLTEAGGTLVDNQLRIHDAAQQERLVACEGTAIRDEQGRVSGAVLVLRDITEQQRMQELMQRSDKLSALGVVAGGIAHDFNNLLGGAFGFIELTRLKAEHPELVRSYMERCLGVFERARNLTQQLLTFAKGGQPIRTITDLGPVLKQSSEFALSGTNVTHRCHVADDLWPCDVDANQMAQVFDNIVLNAQQAMPRGGHIELQADNLMIEAHALLNDGPHVRIRCQDSGPGIPANRLSRVFDPFFTTKESGHGLGLATCHSIVTKHGGVIEVASHEGQGSCFTIYLPAATDEAIAATTHDATSHVGHGQVVIMDDEPSILDVLGGMLDDMGYQAVTARNGNEALAALAREDEVVAVILDLTIPGGMGGRETAKRMHELYPEIPLIASSGYSADPVMAEPDKWCFAAALCKPYLYDDLAATMSRLLARAGDSQAG